MTINQDKLGEFLGTFVTDLGAAIAAGNVVVGHRLGLYRNLAGAPAAPEELAQRTGTDPRYVAEWLRGQAQPVWVGERVGLLVGQRELPGGRVVGHVPARGLPAQPLGQAARHRKRPYTCPV